MTELPPPDPLPMSKGVPGCALGMLGMFLFGLGAQLSVREEIARNLKISRDAGPILAGFGCALFCVSVALVWRLSMKTLIILVLLAAVMIWGVTTLKEVGDERERIRSQQLKSIQLSNPGIPLQSVRGSSTAIDNSIEPDPAEPAVEPSKPEKNSPAH